MKMVVMVLKGNINFDARVQKWIASLTGMGFQVTLIVWNWQPITFTHPGLQIVELNMSGHKIPARAATTFWLNLKFCYLAAQVIKKLQPDYCHFNDLDTLITTFFLKKNKNMRFIYDAHELFPECQTNRMKRTIWNFLERLVVRKADTIIQAEINRARYFRDKYRLREMPHVINNYPHYVQIDPEPIKIQREKLGLTGKIVLVYQGIIGPDRFVREMILSLKYLPEQYVFLLIGIAYQNYEQELQNLVRQEKIEHRVIFYGKVPPQNMIKVLAIGDIGLAFYTFNTLNDYYCAPNKVFDYLMAGLPVVTNKTPALEMVKENNLAEMIDNIQPEDISRGITKLNCVSPQISKEIIKKYSWDSLQLNFSNIYLK